MIRLNVWMRMPDGATLLAAEVAATEPDSNGRFEAEFEYARRWVESAQGFDLDPASLQRSRGPRFAATGFQPPLGLFEDALPDAWGQRLMAIPIKAEGRKPSLPEFLRHIGANGLGALTFSQAAEPPVPTLTGDKGELEDLLEAATAFEAGRLPADNRFRRLIEAGGSPGGARPKALVHDKGVEWIAKFPSIARDEHHDVVALEATCMRLAAAAGLAVPATRLQAIGRRRILLVRRFDVTEQGGRLHMISLKTLCRERPGALVTGYDDVAEAVRKHSADPLADVAALFRQAAFNAAIGNVDDHLKNFWMLHGNDGWRLAPAFDLVPDTGAKRDHTLTFGLGPGCPTRDVLVGMGERWGVRESVDVVDEVTGAVRGFAQAAKRLRVKGAASVRQNQADIDRRLGLLH